MNKFLSIISLLALSSATLNAQQRVTPVGSKSYAIRKVQDSVYDRPFFQRPMAVSLHLGTQGIGASASVQFAHKWSVRLGASVIPVSVSKYSYTVEGTETLIDGNSNFTNIHLLAGWQPFTNAGGFRVIGGLAYVVSGKASASIAPRGDQKAGNITITQDQLGQLNADLDWTGIAPYLGISLFKAIPANRFGVNLDLGCYYLPAPKSTMSGTKLLAGNDTNTPQFTENMKGYRFLPVLQVNFNYKISK